MSVHAIDINALKEQLSQLLTMSTSEAPSLPPMTYGSEEVFAIEAKNIFEKEWVCLGRVDEIENPGDYFTTELVGEPLLVVRGDDGETNVLSNVCRHKWAAVAEGKGNARVFTCPYHAWTYNRSGQLIGAPHMEHTKGFDKKNCRLSKLRSEVWQGFIFATLNDDIASVAERLEDLTPIIANHDMGAMRKFTGEDEVWNTNWKLLVENFTEAYHTFQTHRDSLEKAVPSELTEFDDTYNDNFSAFFSGMSPTEPERSPCSDKLTPEERRRVVLVALFPSLVFALAPDRVFYMCLTPKSAGQVQVRWGVSSYGEEFTNMKIRDIARFYDIVNNEDKERLESIQRGIHSRHATQSSLSWLELSNARFGQYIAKSITR